MVPQLTDLREEILKEFNCSRFVIHPGGTKMLWRPPSPTQPNPIGGSEPKLRGCPAEAINQICLSNTFHSQIFYGSGFNLGQAHKQLHLTKYIYKEGIPCLFKMIYKIDIQSLKCFCKISNFKKNHDMNAQVGAYMMSPITH